MANLNDLIKDIRVALDRNMSSEQLITAADIDTLSLEEIIKGKVLDAIRIVETSCPLRLLGKGTAFPAASQTITWDSQQGYGPGYVKLPTDYLRLVCFKMSDWDHAVYEPIYPDNPLYAVQRSRFAGVRGNPQKPVVAIVNGPDALRLEFYSCAESSNASVAQAAYVKDPAIEGTGDNATVDIYGECRPAVVYCAASLAAQAIGEDKLATSLMENSKALMV